MNRKTPLLILTAIFLVFGLAACQPDAGNSATDKDEATSAQALNDLQKAHPTPSFKRSQLRQNLIDIATAQADTTQTTSFFFLEGVGVVGSCPSIGFPIATTAQLTNPGRETGPRESRIVLPQVEPTGIYTGESSGTYVICVDAKGDAYARYWEGYVQSISGPAEVDDNGQVQLIGPSSFEFDNGKG
jgi:hypothetical protein